MALIAYLKSDKLTLPRAVTSSPSGGVKDAGFVMPSFKVGTIFLRDAEGQYFRLEWDAPKKQTEPSAAKKEDANSRRRALPAGMYKMTGYRIARKDDSGKDWFISATSGHGIRKVQVRSGQTSHVTVSDAIMVMCRARPRKGTLHIQMGIQGEHHSGLSIYREGKRIPVQYLVRNGQNKTLAKGSMEYG